LKIMFQLIKDSYGIRKFSKQAVTSLKKKFFPNRKSTGQNEVNNNIRTNCSNLYRKSFPNSDSLENLP
jgi:hypothetical protein